MSNVVQYTCRMSNVVHRQAEWLRGCEAQMMVITITITMREC